MGDTPNIRFKGFTDAWEQRKLGDIVDVLDGDRGKNYPTGTDFDSNGHTLFLNASNVTNDGFSFQDNQFITEEKSNSMGNGKLEEDDIVITSRGSLGHVAWYNSDIVRIMPYARINSGMLILRKKHEIKTEYLYHFMKSNKGQGQISFMSFGSAQPQLTKKGVENLEVLLPRSRAEQALLGQYFSNLDHLITRHQCKCDEIIELKKYMLQKMFPQNSQKVPELRFAGFTGDWEQHKFSNIVMEKLTNGVMNQQSDSQTDVKHINVINMYVSDKIHVEDLTYSSCDNNAVEKCNVEVGDIFLTRSSLKPEGIAEPNVLLDDGCFVFDDHLIRMKVNKEKYDPLFTKILLSTKPVKKQFIAKSKQNAFTTIGQEDIAESEGLFPSLSEQQEIGKYFSNIDNLITFHQHKCDELKEIKKFMLQNMFPQKG